MSYTLVSSIISSVIRILVIRSGNSPVYFPREFGALQWSDGTCYTADNSFDRTTRSQCPISSSPTNSSQSGRPTHPENPRCYHVRGMFIKRGNLICWFWDEQIISWKKWQSHALKDLGQQVIPPSRHVTSEERCYDVFLTFWRRSDVVCRLS